MNRFWFMLKRFFTDIRENRDLEINIERGRVLNSYYLPFRVETINSRGGNKPFQFDDNGIPMVHSYIDVVENKGFYYYPITIGQYGLALFHRWIMNDDVEAKQQFINIADWFVDKAHHDEKLGVYWLTDIPKPEYKVEKPWKSAFSQSRALSVLLRAWQLTGKEHYFNIAAKALIPYEYDIYDGGVAAHLYEGFPIYEEYVASEPTMVLDGHGFSLFGVYDFMRAVSEEDNILLHQQAKRIFNKGIDGLIHWLPQYDMAYWLRFNLCEMAHYPKVDPCTIGYLRLIVKQFEVLAAISDMKELLHYKQHLESYLRVINILRMYPVKYQALKKLKRV